MCVTGNWLHPGLVVNLFLNPNIFICIWIWKGICNRQTNIICFHSCTCGNWLHPIKSLGRAPQLLSLRGRHGKSGIGHVGLIISLREYINTSISSTIRHWRGKVPINVSPEALSYFEEKTILLLWSLLFWEGRQIFNKSICLWCLLKKNQNISNPQTRTRA